MVLTAESLATGLFTLRTGARTALLVAGMSPTVSYELTLRLTAEGLGALNLFALGSAPEKY